MSKERKRVIKALQVKARYGTLSYLFIMVICLTISLVKFYSSYKGQMYIVELAVMHQIEPPGYFSYSLAVSTIRDFKGDPLILNDLQMRISNAKYDLAWGFIFLLGAASAVSQHRRHIFDKEILQLLQAADQ